MSGINKVKDRSYLSLVPNNDEEKIAFEEKLGIDKHLTAKLTNAVQSMVRKGKKQCFGDDVSRAMCPGSDFYCIGLVTIVATDDEPDGYVAYLCPTRASFDELKRDCVVIGERVGLENADDDFDLGSIFNSAVSKYYQ